MNTKPFYMSKILWLGILVAASEGLKAFGIETGFVVPSGIIAALGGLIAFLRVTSNTTLTSK